MGQSNGGRSNLWKMSCLRPAPPTRSSIFRDDNRTLKKKGKRILMESPFGEIDNNTAVPSKMGTSQDKSLFFHVYCFVSDSDTTYEEDMQILRVIESYCASNKRNTQATISELSNAFFLKE